MNAVPAQAVHPVTHADPQADISARLERLPITRPVFWARNIVGAATFFDGYTVIAIAYAMPVLVREWGLNTQQTGMILSMGYLGQLIGAVLFGWLKKSAGSRSCSLPSCSLSAWTWRASLPRVRVP